MSLLRLLTAGRCLMGLKDPVNRYRVNERALLPKFESISNPFRKTALPGKVPAGGAGGEAQGEAGSQPPPEPAGVNGASATRKGFAGRLSASLKHIVGGGPAGRSTAPTRGKPVQSELALTNIQVVRNDLSESDIEVVPAKQPKPVNDAAPSANGNASGATRGWTRRGMSLLRRAAAGREATKS